MSPDVMVALATFALVLITGIAGLLSLRGLREQLWLVTFTEYTRRYSEIMDALPFEARRPGGQFDLEALPADERDRALGAMRKYLNLSSEELYLHNRAKIDGETWGIWRTGIRDTLRLPCFRGAWRHLRDEYDFFPEFREFIDSLSAK